MNNSEASAQLAVIDPPPPVIASSASNPAAAAPGPPPAGPNPLADPTTNHNHGAKMLLSDVQGAHPTFSGDEDLHDVHEFFAEFEKIAEAMEANEAQKLMFLRRSLRSVAHAVVRDAGAGACSYELLKTRLLEEFRHRLTAEQVYADLRTCRWNRAQGSLELFV